MLIAYRDGAAFFFFLVSFLNYSLTPFLPRSTFFFLLLLCRRIQYTFDHCCVRNCNLPANVQYRIPKGMLIPKRCRPSYLPSESRRDCHLLLLVKRPHFLQFSNITSHWGDSLLSRIEDTFDHQKYEHGWKQSNVSISHSDGKWDGEPQV